MLSLGKLKRGRKPDRDALPGGRADEGVAYTHGIVNLLVQCDTRSQNYHRVTGIRARLSAAGQCLSLFLSPLHVLYMCLRHGSEKHEDEHGSSKSAAKKKEQRIIDLVRARPRNSNHSTSQFNR